MHIHTTITMSRVYIHQTNLPTTIIIHIHHLRLMPIWYALIYDTYMHVVTISPTTRCQQNILCKSTPPLTIQLCKCTPPFTFLIWLNMIYNAWTYKQRPNNAKLSTYTSTNKQCKSTPPFTLTSSSTIALSSIYVHKINKSQFK